jgi:DNA-binding PucR family transcriptional regulator
VPGRTGWLERVRIAVRDQAAVLGPVVASGRADRSVARAQAAWPLHVAGLLGVDPHGLVRADEHLLELLLAAEPELAADLCERSVAPLTALPAGAAARGEQTLRAWLDAHGDVSAAAAALHVHPQTVRYRLAGLRELFGDALDDPGARLELAIAMRMSRPATAHPDPADPAS